MLEKPSKMKILHDSTLVDNLKNSNLFLDTNVFIGALFPGSPISELLKKLSHNECAFLSIQSVLFEFTRGGNTIETFDKRLKFITEDLKTTIYPIEKELDKLEDLIIVLQRIKADASYTDFLLTACLYKFPEAFLLTENHKDFPTEILDRKYLITIDTDKDIRNYAVYQFSLEKYAKAAENILKEH